jgi:hypothetical protein
MKVIWMKNTLYSRTKDMVKNNWSSILVTTTVAACTAMVLFARGCGGISGPMIEGPIRGDGVCEQSEAYPYEMGKDRLFKKDKNGAYAQNKSYSPEDCHTGDGKLQDRMDDLRDMAGNKVTLQLRPGVKAESLGLPEGQDSIDYRLSVVKEQPCIPGTPTKETPKISRPLVSAKPGEMIIRPMDEWEQMVRDPTSLPPSVYSLSLGWNSFKRPWLLEETCDTDPKVPDCAPNVNERCYAANHTSCPPRKAEPPKAVAKCKNGKWEKALGEQCDPTDKKAVRGGCDSGQKCTNACTCVKESEGPKCGDRKVDEGEDCDPPGTVCTTGTAAGTCNKSCVCEEKPKPINEDCPSHVKRNGELVARIGSALNGAAGELRSQLGTSDDMTFGTSISVEGGTGRVSLNGVSASCGGKSCPNSGVNVVSTSGMNLDGITVAKVENDCKTTIYTKVSKE